MKNYIQRGDTITLTAAAAVLSGGGYLAGTLFGVATHDIASGDPGEFAVTGVFELPKTSAQAWTVGAAIYWDDTNKVCTTTSSGNTLIGKAVAAAANPSATGIVRLG